MVSMMKAKCTRCDKDHQNNVNVCLQCEEDLKPTEFQKIWDKLLVFLGRIIQVVFVILLIWAAFALLFEGANNSRKDYDRYDDLNPRQQEALDQYAEDYEDARMYDF